MKCVSCRKPILGTPAKTFNKHGNSTGNLHIVTGQVHWCQPCWDAWVIKYNADQAAADARIAVFVAQTTPLYRKGGIMDKILTSKPGEPK
jgi:hypothetical protein